MTVENCAKQIPVNVERNKKYISINQRRKNFCTSNKKAIKKANKEKTFVGPMPMIKYEAYTIIEEFPLDFVLDLIPSKEDLNKESNNNVSLRRVDIGKHKNIKVGSDRLLMYKQKGVECAAGCGRSGHFWRLETNHGNGPHFNLYAKDGTMMTKDHIIAKSMGGADKLENYQPMCATCNVLKGTKTPEHSDKIFKKIFNKIEPIYVHPKKIWSDLLDFSSGFNSPEYLINIFRLRDLYIEHAMFPILTEETLQLLLPIMQGNKVLEAGAGRGFLAKILSQHKIKIVATDNRSRKYVIGENVHSLHLIAENISIHNVDALKLVHKDFDVIIMSWPDMENETDAEIVKAMKPGQVLIYQGESYGGCTGSDELHEAIFNLCTPDEELNIKLRASHIQWYGIHDYWEVYTRN